MHRSVPKAIAFTAGIAAAVASLVSATASDIHPGLIDCGVGKMVVVPNEAPIWFFGGGASVRSINSSFSNSAPKFDEKSGRGNVGFYAPGKERVDYDDGHVNYDKRSRRGGAGGYVEEEGQITAHPLGESYGGNRNYVVSFHTDGYQYSGGKATGDASDSDNGVAPYLSLGRKLAMMRNFNVNFVTGWSLLKTSHSTGPRQVTQLVEDRTAYTYQYDYVANPGLPKQIPGKIEGTNELLVIDPDAVLIGWPGTPLAPGYRSPSLSSESFRTVYTAVSTSDLDVTLNEIPFGFEIGRAAGPVDIFLTGGATLNVINYELTNRVDWYASGSSSPVASEVSRDSGTPLKVGLYGGILARCNLTDDGKLYLESSGTYRWVDPVQASAGSTTVEIDPSSWEGRFGLGMRF